MLKNSFPSSLVSGHDFSRADKPFIFDVPSGLQSARNLPFGFFPQPASLEQRLLPATVGPRTLHAKVLIRQMRSHTSSWCAVQKSNLDKERLVDFLDGVSLLRQRCRQRVHPHRPALILFDDGEQQLAVDFVKAVAIDLEHLQRRL